MGRPKRDREEERMAAERVIEGWFPNADRALPREVDDAKPATGVPFGSPEAGPVTVWSRAGKFLRLEQAHPADVSSHESLGDGPGRWGYEGTDGVAFERGES